MSIDGVPIADRIAQGNVRGVGRRFTNTRSVTWEAEQPSDVSVLEGAWWSQGNATEPVVSVKRSRPRRLQIQPGDWIEIDVSGRTIRARVVAIHEVEAMRFMPTAEFVFNPRRWPGCRWCTTAACGCSRRRWARSSARCIAKFPTVTVVNIADALEIVQQVVDQIALVIRFLSGFAILAGAMILAASVAGTRFRRVREVVILKTLGATRQQVQRIFSVEFLALGAVAGLMGRMLAAAFSSLVLKRLLDAKFQFDSAATAVAIVLTALLANASGWLASFRILRQKPLEVLREE